QVACYRDLMDRIEPLPDVEASGAASAIPFRPDSNGPFQIEGQPPARPGDPVISGVLPRVTPGYFRAIGIRLRRGRVFTWADNEDAPLVAIVNETLARQSWPGEDPLGKRISIENRKGEPVWRQVA